MELEYTDKNSRRAKLYIGVGLIIALLVAAAVFFALQASGLTSEGEVEMREVVVAAAEIPSRRTIEESDVVVRRVVADATNETAFTSIDQVVGRVAGVTIAPGQLITLNLLASTTEGATFSILEPGEAFDPEGPDLRAVSVNVPDDRAVAGTLQPGQQVDLVATLTINPVDDEGQEGDEAEQAPEPGDFVAGPSTKVTMQAISILARNGALYILRTDLATAEKIAEIQAAGGQFSLALRPEQDDRTAETDGSTLDMLVEEFGFPAPQIAELEGR